jgi:SHS2 domain-containing protein
LELIEAGANGSEPSNRFETFEHKADIGIRGFGNTIEEAFANTALALYSVMVNINEVKQRKKKSITASAPDIELLLVEWLNSLLSLSDVERIVFSKFKVTIDGLSLRGMAWGEPLDRVRHESNVEVKGATYHMLSVKREAGIYIAQCVVDV